MGIQPSQNPSNEVELNDARAPQAKQTLSLSREQIGGFIRLGVQRGSGRPTTFTKAQIEGFEMYGGIDEELRVKASERLEPSEMPEQGDVVTLRSRQTLDLTSEQVEGFIKLGVQRGSREATFFTEDQVRAFQQYGGIYGEFDLDKHSMMFLEDPRPEQKVLGKARKQIDRLEIDQPEEYQALINLMPKYALDAPYGPKTNKDWLASQVDMQNLAIKNGHVSWMITGLFSFGYHFIEEAEERVQGQRDLDENLRKFPMLKVLMSRHQEYGTLDFARDLPRLVQLYTYGDVGKDCSGLSETSGLVRLSFEYADIENGAGIASHTGLKSLSLKYCHKLLDTSFVPALGELEEVELDQVPLQDFEDFRQSKNLKKISMCGYCDSYWHDVRSLSGVEGCDDLESFELTHAKLLKSAVQLGECKKLKRALFTKVNLQALDFTKGAESLESLYITDCPVSDFSPIEGHPSLKEVRFSGVKASNISVLPSIPNLEKATLRRMNIDSLRPLLECGDNLKEVYLEGSKYPEEDAEVIEQLRARGVTVVTEYERGGL